MWSAFNPASGVESVWPGGPLFTLSGHAVQTILAYFSSLNSAPAGLILGFESGDWYHVRLTGVEDGHGIEN